MNHPLSHFISHLDSRLMKVAVVGLGYVGRPLFLALSKSFDCIGYDINQAAVDRVAATGGYSASSFVTSNAADLSQASVLIVAVPTPVKEGNKVDLEPLISSSETIGKHCKWPILVIYESTAYPGITKEMVEVIERANFFTAEKNLFWGYSPERITPGDKEHELHNTNKIISACDEESLKVVRFIYQSIVTHAELYEAPSVEVAEAAKVVENVQRDVNIALMNDLTKGFHKLGIDFREVLKAAKTKWNFGNYAPGLVGGHCIPVDPWYLEHKFNTKGFYSKLLPTSRSVSDSIPDYIANSVFERLHRDRKAQVLQFGLTYKPDVCDWRDSRAIELAKALTILMPDTFVDDELICQTPSNKKHKAFTDLRWAEDELSAANYWEVDAIVLAVPHKQYAPKDLYQKLAKTSPPVLVVDVCGVLDRKEIEKSGHNLWVL